MCGILGFYSFENKPYKSLEKSLDFLNSRGPDALGIWEDEYVYLGHRRLSIIDLDERSNQPMFSNCNRYIIVFNGEIYNYQELRNELKDYNFNTKSDTEVLLALYSIYKEKMLVKLKGMFSFIIWDKIEKISFVARDAYGIKPLYIGKLNNGLLLSSQVSSIIASGLVNVKKCKEGTKGFAMLGSVPEPFTWYENIKSLKAGHYLIIRNNKIEYEKEWFNISNIWINSFNKHRAIIPENILKLKVRDLLLESVSRHLIADVPVGVFLSGGIDSGVLSALMVECGARDITGITISYDEFEGKDKDESSRAKLLADSYGINHHVRVVKKKEFLEDLPIIMRNMDQPTVDGINTWYASKAASELGLKVVVSGVGGDELFYGYDIFNELPPIVNKFNFFKNLPLYEVITNTLFYLISLYKKNNRWKFAGNWLKTIEGAWWLRRSIRSPDENPYVIKNFSPKKYLKKLKVETTFEHKLSLAMIESKMYLKNQLLRDSDWASMSHSIELRTPLVDRTLLISLEKYLYSLTYYSNKKILASSPVKPLPIEILNSKKTGFGIPIKEWLGIEENANNQLFHSLWTKKIVDMYNSKSYE